MSWFRRQFDRALYGAIALCTGTALLLACEAMVARYAWPDLTLDWVPELVIFLVIWAVFLSAAELAGRGAHIRVDLVVRLLPPRARRALAIGAAVLGIAVATGLAWSGIAVVRASIEWDERTTSSLGTPLWIYYLCLPVGGVLLALRLCWRISDLWIGRTGSGPGHDALD